MPGALVGEVVAVDRAKSNIFEIDLRDRRSDILNFVGAEWVYPACLDVTLVDVVNTTERAGSVDGLPFTSYFSLRDPIRNCLQILNPAESVS